MSGPFVQALWPAGPYGIRWRGPQLIIERLRLTFPIGFSSPRSNLLAIVRSLLAHLEKV